jgi:protease YdgD
MRLLSLAISALLAFAALPARAEGPPPLAGVGLIQHKTGAYWHCTGALIAPDLVLTSAHCLAAHGQPRPGRPADFSFALSDAGGHFGKPRRIARIWLNPDWPRFAAREPGRPPAIERDLALAKLVKPVAAAQARPFRIGAAPARAGAALVIASFGPGLKEPMRSRGCRLKLRLGEVLYLDCRIRAGESGGAVFAETGNGPVLVAIVSSRIDFGALGIGLAPRLGQHLRELFAGAGIAPPRP